MITSTPPGFMKMASGKIVPISRSFSASKAKTKKFLLVIQYYGGDVQEAEELALLIADLERTRNHDADVLLFRRADSREMSATVRAKLEAKFDKVILQTCRRVDAKGYPHGSNQMWSDLISLMMQTQFATDYYAFINLESDAVPTRQGWISELIEAWRAANAQGKGAIGHMHDNPVPHLNGLAVYATDMYRRVASSKLLGCNPQICYDIYFANFLRPHAVDTPLIYFSYRKPTITAEELYGTMKNGVAPALYHGVKDASARAAVRARHISFTAPAPIVAPKQAPAPSTLGVAASIGFEVAAGFGSKAVEAVASAAYPRAILDQKGETPSSSELSLEKLKEFNAHLVDLHQPRPNAYCYHQPASKANHDEQQAIQAIWRKAWASRGFNPVVLTLRDAARNPRFDDFQVKIERFPYIGGKKDAMNRFNRWLALEMAGGGLMVDVDVLPGDFTPNDTEGETSLVLASESSGIISAAILDLKKLQLFIHEIELYDAQPEDVVEGRECVTDMTIFGAKFHPDDENEYFRNVVVDHSADVTGKLIRFSENGTVRRSVAMQRFLSGHETVVA